MKLSSKRQQGKAEPELSSTSMIDVVFLLLIFFLVTSTFVKPEKEYRPTIQVNDKSASSKSSDLEKAIVDIVLDGDRYVFQVGGVKTDSDKKLVEILRGFSDKTQGAFVRAPDSARFDFPARAHAACRTAGFPAVTYVPLEKE